jgi:hypothetical protein
VAIEAAEKERDALAQEVETLRVASGSPTLAPTPENPLAHVTQEEQLGSHEGFARQLRTWARTHLGNGGEMPAAMEALLSGKRSEEIAEPRTWTAEDAANFLEQAETMLEQTIPQRREYLRTEKETGAWLKANHPEYLDTKTTEGQLFASFARQFPQVKALPRWQTVLASAVRGHLEFERDQQRAVASNTAAGGDAGDKARKPEARSQMEEPLAPVPPSAGRGNPAPKPAGGTSAARKPAPRLRPNMDADELAAAL